MQKEIDDRLANLLLAGKVEDGVLVKADVAADGEGLVVTTE
jgi:ATP-dependent Clp protease ATP-binding subunit ClpB